MTCSSHIFVFEKRENQKDQAVHEMNSFFRSSVVWEYHNEIFFVRQISLHIGVFLRKLVIRLPLCHLARK